jgi:hypothetical protein
LMTDDDDYASDAEPVNVEESEQMNERVFSFCGAPLPRRFD